jgi:hypothetical protein
MKTPQNRLILNTASPFIMPRWQVLSNAVMLTQSGSTLASGHAILRSNGDLNVNGT